MGFREPRVLGRTGLRVCPLGVASSYGAPTEAFEEAFERVGICITGPKNRAQMREALRALDLGPLSEEELARIKRIGDHVHANYRRLVFG